MCNRYHSPSAADIRAQFATPDGGAEWSGGGVFPRAPGPFVRQRRPAPGRAVQADPGLGLDPSQGRELVLGQWALIPSFAKSPRLPYSTNNARSEELATKPSYKLPWARGQRCIVPAWSFDEPCWESGRNVWWRFHRADGRAWGLAGLWHTWVDPLSGALCESYTLLTTNADAHPLMGRMHKPDPQLPPDQQDKRSVVAIADQDAERWLSGSQAQAQALLLAPPVAGVAPEVLASAGGETGWLDF